VGINLQPREEYLALNKNVGGNYIYGKKKSRVGSDLSDHRLEGKCEASRKTVPGVKKRPHGGTLFGQEETYWEEEKQGLGGGERRGS